MSAEIVLLAGVALLVGACTSATTSFERVVGGPGVDRGIFVGSTNDGGYVAVGLTDSFGAGAEDVYLVKTDAAGTVVWTETYGGEGSDNGWAVREVDGGFVVAGFTDSFGAGGVDCYLFATDADGRMLWSNTFGGSGDDYCWGLVVTDDGGYALVGETTSRGGGEEDCYLVRTDASGSALWSRAYGGMRGDRCFSIAPVDGGGFVLAGQTYSEGAGDRDAYVLRVDSDGAERWSRTFGGAESDVAHSVARTSEADYIVTGYTTSLAIDDDDPFVIRIDSVGDVTWSRVIELAGYNHTITGEQTTDGGFILGGFSEYADADGRSALLVKTDSAGNLEWHRDLLYTTAGSSFGYTVRATSDGGSVLTGHTTEGSAGELDLFVIKVDQ